MNDTLDRLYIYTISRWRNHIITSLQTSHRRSRRELTRCPKDSKANRTFITKVSTCSCINCCWVLNISGISDPLKPEIIIQDSICFSVALCFRGLIGLIQGAFGTRNPSKKCVSLHIFAHSLLKGWTSSITWQGRRVWWPQMLSLHQFF